MPAGTSAVTAYPSGPAGAAVPRTVSPTALRAPTPSGLASTQVTTRPDAVQPGELPAAAKVTGAGSVTLALTPAGSAPGPLSVNCNATVGVPPSSASVPLTPPVSHRSATGCTVAVAEALLSAVPLSSVAAAMIALVDGGSVRSGARDWVTVTVTVASVSSSPSSQPTVPAFTVHGPTTETAETICSPGPSGTVWFTVTFSAAAGPWLVAVTVQVSGWPGTAGPPAAAVRARSAVPSGAADAGTAAVRLARRATTAAPRTSTQYSLIPASWTISL